MARGLYKEIPLNQPQHAPQDPPNTRRPPAPRAPIARQDIDSELEISDRQRNRQRRRNQRPRRQARGFYGETSLDEARRATMRSKTNRRPATSQDSDSETPMGEY